MGGGLQAATTASSSASSLAKWAAAAEAINAVAQIASGFAANQAAKEEAALQQRQADIAWEEAQAEAKQKARQARRFASEQAMTFAKSGVTLQGTPAQVLAETEALGQEEVQAVLRRGQAQAAIMRQQASMTRRAGRMAMFGGLMKGFGTGLQTYINYKSFGLQNQPEPIRGLEPAGLDYSWRQPQQTAYNFNPPILGKPGIATQTLGALG